MSFANVGKVWTTNGLKDYLSKITPPKWCTGICVHHTAEPSLKQRPKGFTAQHIENMKYGYVHDRDVMFSRNVWEIIDLDERINFPMYFPIDTNNIGKDRRSLFDILTKGIESGRISEVYADSYFASKRTSKEIESICEPDLLEKLKEGSSKILKFICSNESLYLN
jgi:hypothetical protein